jgi:iron(III) transport system substrate-binding protein
MEEDLMKGVLAAFEKKYPGVKINFIRKSSGPFATLVETERSVGKCSLDVVHTSEPSDIERWKNEGYLMAYKTENWDMIPIRDKNKDGYYCAMGISVMLGAYNPKIIKPSEAPKSYKDFLNPKFKKMMSNSSPSRGGTGMIAAMRVIELYGWDYIKALAEKQESMFVAGHGTVVSMVISGERPLAWEASGYRVLEEDAKGAPCKHIWHVEGPPLYWIDMGIPQKAPHPAAAKLLMNYLSSREGQEIFVKETNFWSPLPRMRAPVLMKPLEEMNVWYPDKAALLKNTKEVAEKFDQIFGLK